MTATTREDIAANVRAAVARRQVDQRTIATAIGRSQAAVSDRLRGATDFRATEIVAIATLLDVTLDDLIGRPESGQHGEDGHEPLAVPALQS